MLATWRMGRKWYKLAWLATVIVLLRAAAVGSVDLSTAFMNLSLSISDKGGGTRQETLSFPLYNPELELGVGSFCERHDIAYHQCRKLYDAAAQKLAQELQRVLRKTLVNPGFDAATVSSVPNAHWLRHPAALQAEESGTAQRKATIADIETAERNALHIIAQSLAHPSAERVVFVHSCLLEGQSPQILLNLLERLRRADLPSPVIVLHYGVPLQVHVADSKLQLLYVHVSHMTHFFEVPSIRIIHKFALAEQQHGQSHGVSQILYLHTKGVSYQSLHTELEDWKDMMLYALLEKHPSCYHLLHSGEFDVIGSNFHSHPRALSGNFWWATSAYLSRLPSLHYRLADKYAPERWVLTGIPAVRLYIPHTGHFQHTRHGYPRHCYAPSETPPSFEVWTADCLNDNEEDYVLLHHADRAETYEWTTAAKYSLRPTGLVLFNK